MKAMKSYFHLCNTYIQTSLVEVIDTMICLSSDI